MAAILKMAKILMKNIENVLSSLSFNIYINFMNFDIWAQIKLNIKI